MEHHHDVLSDRPARCRQVILLSLTLGFPGSPAVVSSWWLAFTAFVGANLPQDALFVSRLHSNRACVIKCLSVNP
jgi:hypothetical protein